MHEKQRRSRVSHPAIGALAGRSPLEPLSIDLWAREIVVEAKSAYPGWCVVGQQYRRSAKIDQMPAWRVSSFPQSSASNDEKFVTNCLRGSSSFAAATSAMRMGFDAHDDLRPCVDRSIGCGNEQRPAPNHGPSQCRDDSKPYRQCAAAGFATGAAPFQCVRTLAVRAGRRVALLGSSFSNERGKAGYLLGRRDPGRAESSLSTSTCRRKPPAVRRCRA
jgi:hypothetical protein